MVARFLTDEELQQQQPGLLQAPSVAPTAAPAPVQPPTIGGGARFLSDDEVRQQTISEAPRGLKRLGLAAKGVAEQISLGALETQTAALEFLGGPGIARPPGERPPIGALESGARFASSIFSPIAPGGAALSALASSASQATGTLIKSTKSFQVIKNFFAKTAQGLSDAGRKSVAVAFEGMFGVPQDSTQLILEKGKKAIFKKEFLDPDAISDLNRAKATKGFERAFDAVGEEFDRRVTPLIEKSTQKVNLRSKIDDFVESLRSAELVEVKKTPIGGAFKTTVVEPRVIQRTTRGTTISGVAPSSLGPTGLSTATIPGVKLRPEKTGGGVFITGGPGVRQIDPSTLLERPAKFTVKFSEGIGDTGGKLTKPLQSILNTAEKVQKNPTLLRVHELRKRVDSVRKGAAKLFEEGNIDASKIVTKFRASLVDEFPESYKEINAEFAKIFRLQADLGLEGKLKPRNVETTLLGIRGRGRSEIRKGLRALDDFLPEGQKFMESILEELAVKDFGRIVPSAFRSLATIGLGGTGRLGAAAAVAATSIPRVGVEAIFAGQALGRGAQAIGGAAARGIGAIGPTVAPRAAVLGLAPQQEIGLR